MAIVKGFFGSQFSVNNSNLQVPVPRCVLSRNERLTGDGGSIAIVSLSLLPAFSDVIFNNIIEFKAQRHEDITGMNARDLN